MAVAARAGDRDALVALYVALEPKITRFVRRYRGWSGATWDADDIAQEAYLALAALVAKWSGEGPFLPYFFACYRFRLRDAVRCLGREDRHFVRTPHEMDPPGYVQTLNEKQPPTFYSPWVESADHFAGDAFAAAELRTDLAALLPADRALLAWRIEEGERFTEIAAQLDVNRRTVHRRWSRLRLALEQIAA